MSDYRTETQALEDDIRAACQDIRDGIPHIMPTTAPAQRISGGGGRAVGIIADRTPPDGTNSRGYPYWKADNTRNDHDIDPLTRRASLARETNTILTVWVNRVRTDRPITNAATLPLTNNPAAMTRFIETHAEWLSWHETGPEARDELRDLARTIERAGPPPISDKPLPPKPHLLGTCREEFEFDPESGPETCGGKVYAYGETTTDLTIPEQRETRLPTCRRCGTEGTVDWWYRHMFDGAELSHLVTIDELIGVIAVRLQWVVTHGQIRQWKTRQKFGSSGKDSKGRTLYRLDEVLGAVRDDIDKQKAKTRA